MTGVQLARVGLLVALAGTSACKRDDDSDDTDDLGELIGILVSPERVIVPVGDEVQLRATGLYDDRSSSDLTAVVSWSSSDPSVAEVSDGLDQEGLVIAKALGSSSVRALMGDVESPAVEVQVTDATVLGLAVEPESVSVQVGDTVQLRATAAYSDGTRADSSTQVRWITASGAVAQLESDGLLTAAGVGSTHVHAEWDGLESNEVPVEVLQTALADLRVQGVSAETGGGQVVLTVDVENAGSAGASEAWVDLFIDPPSTPQFGEYGDGWDVIEYIEPDDAGQVTFEFEAEAGTHDIYVLVDIGEWIEESDESNNGFGTTIEVGSTSTGGPNLTFTSFDYIADESYIYYAVDVYNAGTEDVGEFYVDVWVDHPYEPVLGTDGDDYVTVESLGAGEATIADFLIETYCYYCLSWILVDSYNYIDETNEDDNVGGPIPVYSE